MIIHPEIRVTPDLPTIRFSEPRDQVDLDIEIPRILNREKWGCSTYFKVQFINHEKTEVLASAEFVVVQEIQGSYTNAANPSQPMTSETFKCKAEIIGKWWYSSLEKAKGQKGGVVKWNPGLKVHQLIINDEVVYADANKDKVLEAQAA